jgi:hypothetical protein
MYIIPKRIVLLIAALVAYAALNEDFQYKLLRVKYEWENNLHVLRGFDLGRVVPEWK